MEESIKSIIEFYETNNIPYQMIQGFPIHIDPKNSISLKCDTCKKVYKLPTDIYNATLSQADPFGMLEYITLDCVYCEKGTMIPLTYFRKHTKN